MSGHALNLLWKNVMKIFNRFLLYLAIGMLCSLIPFLHVSLAIGFPAVLLNSIILTFIYNKDLKKIPPFTCGVTFDEYCDSWESDSE
jgi:hypothetical protein